MKANLTYNFSVLRRSALATTDTEETLIAAAAIIGESNVPKTASRHDLG
jgi:hypothetical protein